MESIISTKNLENIKIGDFVTGCSLLEMLKLEKALVKYIPTAKIILTDSGKGYVAHRWKE